MNDKLHDSDIVAGVMLRVATPFPVTAVNGSNIVMYKGRKLYVVKVEGHGSVATVAFSCPLRDPAGHRDKFLTFRSEGFKYCLYINVYKLIRNCKLKEG